MWVWILPVTLYSICALKPQQRHVWTSLIRAGVTAHNNIRTKGTLQPFLHGMQHKVKHEDIQREHWRCHSFSQSLQRYLSADRAQNTFNYHNSFIILDHSRDSVKRYVWCIRWISSSRRGGKKNTEMGSRRSRCCQLAATHFCTLSNPFAVWMNTGVCVCVKKN